MIVWALQYKKDKKLFWTGNDLAFCYLKKDAVLLYRRVDCEKILQGHPTLDAVPIEVEINANAEENRPEQGKSFEQHQLSMAFQPPATLRP